MIDLCVRLIYYLGFGEPPKGSDRLALIRICAEAEDECRNRGWDTTMYNVVKVLLEGLTNEQNGS